MSSQVNDSESESQSKKADFIGLEPLLKESLMSKELEIANYTATKLLPPGENYCSIMVKLDIKFRRNKSAKEETLHLVAKTPSYAERPIVDWPVVFKKELFMYAELRPLYRELERDVGIEEDKLIDVWPEYIGYRNSLKDNKIVDEDSALLLQNMKAAGFYNCNRRSGLDIHHARIALTNLARYHAAGIAMKHKRPEFAIKAANQARLIGMDFPQFDEGLDGVRRTFVENPALQKHLAIIETSFNQTKGGKTWKAEPTEPWAAITHGDFWTNNMLFHKDDGGNVDDVKFVDFQMYLYSSPLKDVPYFLCGSLSGETQMNCLDELINLYYNTFINMLKRHKCDVSTFTKESFDRELKKQAINEFSLCALVMKFFVHENDDENKRNDEVMNDIFDSKPSDIFINKLKGIIELYERMGWFAIC